MHADAEKFFRSFRWGCVDDMLYFQHLKGYQIRCSSYGHFDKCIRIPWILLCRSKPFITRPEALHEGRRRVVGYHGQTNLSFDWQSYDTRCVSCIPIQSAKEIDCLFKAWPTVFVKVAILLYPLMVWVTPDRRSLCIITSMRSEWMNLGSCIRWITLAKKIIDLTQFWKRRLTFSSSCMQITSWMLPVPPSCKLEAPLLILTQLSREFLYQKKLYRSNSHFHSAGCASL